MDARLALGLGRRWHTGSNKKVVQRERRTFSAEFKAEAVGLVAARRPDGVSPTQTGRQ